MKYSWDALTSLVTLVLLRGEMVAAEPKTDLCGDPLPAGAIARFGTLRLRHPQGVSALVLSRDGKRVISGGEDGTVRVWDLASGRELRRFKTGWPFIAQLALSPDGRLLGAVANDGRKDDIQGVSPRLWDLTTGKELAKQPPYKNCYSLAFAPDGKTVAIGPEDGVRLWDIAAGRELRHFPDFSAMALTFSPNGKMLAGAGGERRICLWETSSGKELRSLRSPEPMTTGLAFSPDGKLLVSASRWKGKAVYVWDPHTGKELRRLGTGGSLSLAFSPDGRMLATTGRLRLWDPATGKGLHQFKVNNRFIARAFTPDGKALVGSYGETIGVWELATGKERSPVRGHSSWVYTVAFSPDGRTLATGSYDGTARTWDAATGRQRLLLEATAEGRVSQVAFSPDGRTLATLGEDIVQLWQSASGKPLRTFHFPGSEVCCIAFAPDGRLLTSERVASSDLVRAWDPARGKETLAMRVPRTVCSLAVSPDGKWLASGSDRGKLSLFDASTGARVRALAGHKDNVLCLAFAPDSRALVSAEDDDDGTILVWEVETGKPRLRLRMGGGRVRGVCIAPNNRLLAAAGTAGVRLWELATGREVRRLAGHRGVVTAVAFSPDGRTLASASADSTALLWDVAALTGRKSRLGP